MAQNISDAAVQRIEKYLNNGQIRQLHSADQIGEHGGGAHRITAEEVVACLDPVDLEALATDGEADGLIDYLIDHFEGRWVPCPSKTSQTRTFAIIELLAGDLRRKAEADDAYHAAVTAAEKAVARDDEDGQELWLGEANKALGLSYSAAQSFAARTELLQHVPLGTSTVESVIRSALFQARGIVAENDSDPTLLR